MRIIAAIRQYRLFSLNVASYCFNPGIFSTLITMALLYLMISLGFWQLDRAEFKDTLQQNIAKRKTLSASTLDQLPVSMEDRRYLPVELVGEYDPKHSFLLDNKTHKGRVGYHVYTPFQTTELKWVLIARGFVGQGKTRQQLPEVKPVATTVKLHGLLDLPPSRALLLAENVQQTERWPVVLQYLDIAELNQMLGYTLYDMVVWLDEGEPGSLDYDLPVLNLNAAKNNGYAFQWFAMSLALLIIFIVVNTKHQSKLADN